MKMPEQEMHPAAAKFISSLVKSLQILCNGQVEFDECIELVGHINVKVDRIHKFDYIVDEQVSREGDDSSTTFLSNSYHSSPPRKSSQKTSASQQNDLSDFFEQDIPHPDNNFPTSLSTSNDSERKQDEVIVKLEGNESDDCMVLPASPGDYEQVEGINAQETLTVAGPSSAVTDSYEMDYDGQVKQLRHPGKKRKTDGQDTNISGEGNNAKVAVEICSDLFDGDTRNPNSEDRCIKGSELDVAHANTTQSVEGRQETEQVESNNDSRVDEIHHCLTDLKQNIVQLTSLLDMQSIPKELGDFCDSNFLSINRIRSLKKIFLQNMDKDKIKKIKDLLKGKKGKRKKQELRTLIAECGISEVQLRSLACETVFMRNSLSLQRDQRKAYKLRTQERQQKLLEMAEILKRNQRSDSGVPIVSKIGNKKVTLNKSSISIVSHQTQILTPDTIDEAVESLTGKKKRQKAADKVQDQKSDSAHKRQNIKRKMRQIVSKLLRDINESGYRAKFTSTIGSDAGSHSAELTIVPIHVDDILPEVKDDCKLEMSEEDYAKHLEREQLLEKQKANEEKMKEMEIRLTHILTGVEEIIMQPRKRYGPGDSRPTDAERMKLYRRKLKEDPDKYQEYKQKRSLRTRKRRLSLLAAKMKEKASVAAAAAVSITTNPVNEENHPAQSMTLSQPVGTVNIHCPQVYGHPNTHQPTVSAVNVHRTGQYVGQVGGMHGSHQHQQPLTYSNEMDIVELIAASHNVQNQHFG